MTPFPGMPLWRLLGGSEGEAASDAGLAAYAQYPPIEPLSGLVLLLVLAGVGSLVMYGHLWDRLRTRRPTGRGVTAVAVVVAGRRRSHLRDEWIAHLDGAPEEGIVLTPREQRRAACGFLLSALRMRLLDLTRPVWRPVDWLLAAESRTNGFIAAAVGAQAVCLVGDGGLRALVAEVWEPCGVLGAGLYVLARWLRRVRGIELAATTGSPEE